jgi:hypothetical protein
MMSKRINYWVCDNSYNTGEGRLASFFLQDLKKNYKIKKIKQTYKNAVINHRYISPFVGIFYCWIYYLKNKKVCYINYLPLWNFLIFLLLPPRTIIGPITGGAQFVDESFFIRSYLFPILYKISEIIINKRNYNIIFATELLKNYLSKKTKKKSIFNYIVKKFNYKNKNKKKNIDFIVYYRVHKNKKSLFPYKFIHNLIAAKFKIIIIGDKLKHKKVINYGNISNYNLTKLQAKAKYTIASAENIYSLFTLECITHNMKIIIDKKNKSKIRFYKSSFLKINFENTKELNKIKLI